MSIPHCNTHYYQGPSEDRTHNELLISQYLINIKQPNP